MKTARALGRASLSVLLGLAAACAAPAQPAPSEAPDATQPPATAAPTSVPAAGLSAGVLASSWDAAAKTSALVVVDPATGEPLADYPPITLDEGFSAARSPDGRWLAALGYLGETCEAWAGGTRCRQSDGRLHLIDLPAWRDRPTAVQAPTHASLMLFSPDSRFLVVGQSGWPDHTVLLVDTASGALLAQAPLDFYPRQAAFSTDGQRLMVYGPAYDNGQGFNPVPRAALLNAADLSALWQITLPDVRDGQYVPAEAENVHDESVMWQPAVVFAPEAERLYLVHADAEALTTVDFAAQAVATVKVGPAQSWLDRLMALTAGVAEAKMMNGAEKHAVLSADGQRLYVAGARVETRQGQLERTPLGLQVIDTATGVELAHIESAAGSYLFGAPGGRHVVLMDWGHQPMARIVALDGLTTVKELDGFEILASTLLDGEPALFALRHQPPAAIIQPLDRLTFEPLAEWKMPGSLWLLP